MSTDVSWRLGVIGAFVPSIVGPVPGASVSLNYLVPKIQHPTEASLRIGLDAVGNQSLHPIKRFLEQLRRRLIADSESVRERGVDGSSTSESSRMRIKRRQTSVCVC